MTDAAPPLGGFGGTSREVEVKHENEITVVAIPIKVAVVIAAACNAITVLVYLGGVLLWIKFRTGWEPWYRALWRWLNDWFPFLAGPLILEWCVSLGLLVAQFVRKTINPNWPPTTNPVDWEVSGYATHPRGIQQPTDTDEAEADTLPHDWHVRIQLESPNRAQRRYVEFDIERDYADNWQRYCEALANGHGFLAPRFSRAGARRFGLPWDVFRPIQREFLARGLAAQEASSNNSGRVVLNARGRAVCRAFATTPPPQF